MTPKQLSEKGFYGHSVTNMYCQKGLLWESIFLCSTQTWPLVYEHEYMYLAMSMSILVQVLNGLSLSSASICLLV